MQNATRPTLALSWFAVNPIQIESKPLYLAGKIALELVPQGTLAERIRAGGAGIPAAAFFHHADSLAMVRGGHLDVAILGAYQVAKTGDLANWSTGPNGIPAAGGAMDLGHGARQVAVITEHVTKDGAPKLVQRCTWKTNPVAGFKDVVRSEK